MNAPKKREELLKAASNVRRWAADEPHKREHYEKLAQDLEAEAASNVVTLVPKQQSKPEPKPQKLAQEARPPKPEKPAVEYDKLIDKAAERIERKLDEVVKGFAGARPRTSVDRADVMAAIEGLAKTMAAPKRIVRDDEGRPIGVECVEAEAPESSAKPSAGAADIMAAIEALAKTMAAPKRIVRDGEGRPVGLEGTELSSSQ